MQQPVFPMLVVYFILHKQYLLRKTNKKILLNTTTSIFNASIYFHFFSKEVAGEFNDVGEEVGI